MVYLSYCHTKKMCVVKQLPNDTNPIMMTDSLKSERYKKNEIEPGFQTAFSPYWVKIDQIL